VQLLTKPSAVSRAWVAALLAWLPWRIMPFFSVCIVADTESKRLRILHLVGADFHSTPHPLLLPLLTRGKRQHIDSHAVHFVPGAPQFAVVRQSGLPVHDVALSKQRFSFSAIGDLKKIVANVKPDLIHAWGNSAQPAAKWLAGGKGKDSTPVVWSIARTTPLKANPGYLDKFVFDLNKRYAKDCQRIVYSSAAAAAQHRRVGILDDASDVIAPGVDAARFKPDPQARQKVRQQLELPKDAVLIGMYAPYQPEFDHANFIKAVGEIVRLNTHAYVVLAGRAMARGNAPLMAMIGGGTLGTRTRVIGEWSDFGALFNACDVVCSSSTTDSTRLMLATAMLCGVLCVGTSVGAQGEVISNFGASVEPGSPEAMVRGLRRILDMPIERKAFMVREARKHILQNFNMGRSIEKYHELYFELVKGAVPEGVVTPITLDLDVPYTITAPSMTASAAIPTAEKEASKSDVADALLGRSSNSVSANTATVSAPAAMQPSKAPIQTESTPELVKTAATARPVLDDKPFDIDLTPSSSGGGGKIKHQVVDNVMDWSDADAQLIEAVIVKDDQTKPTEFKLEVTAEPKVDLKTAAQPTAKPATPTPKAVVKEIAKEVTKEVATKAIEAKPTDSKPVESIPSDSTSPETKPDQVKLAATTAELKVQPIAEKKTATPASAIGEQSDTKNDAAA
jgi:glycosyltransferase involved in cell wall biosynthesis